MNLDENIIVAVGTALSLIIGKLGISKVFAKKSNNELFIELLKSNIEYNNKLALEFKTFNTQILEGYTNINNSIDKLINKLLPITITNRNEYMMLLTKFSLDLKSKFINLLFEIYEKNHISYEKTILDINRLFVKLINEFYAEITSINGVINFMADSNKVLNIINTSIEEGGLGVPKQIYDIYMQCKLDNSINLKRELSKVFDQTFSVVSLIEK